MSNKTIRNDKITHKGYTGSIEISIEDSCLHGRVLFIDDIVSYEGETVQEIIVSFKNAVDRYITYCKESGKPANKPYSGTFNVRIGKELHRQAAQAAHSQNINLNDFVAQSVRAAVNQSGVVKIELTHNHNVIITDSKAAGTKVATMAKPQSWEKISATH